MFVFINVFDTSGECTIFTNPIKMIAIPICMYLYLKQNENYSYSLNRYVSDLFTFVPK